MLQQIVVHTPHWVWALLAALGSGAWSWSAAGRTGAVPHPERGTVFLRGSWLPLSMMIAVFAVKYTVGVLHALHSGYVQGRLFTATVGLLYGLFIGVSLGCMLRILHLYRQAQLPSAQPAI
ncbi:hypothetical protein [Herbaspirillum sp. RV1423]|uniref:hypothetical protein n=1 Tax=Herbaspirillum sp. RV1423 TaxID=1443993 RepID=UPI0004BAF222|nr:hypothetical protein [Herbaspirillum sp. RV1423]